jgi:hypothetical protein
VNRASVRKKRYKKNERRQRGERGNDSDHSVSLSFPFSAFHCIGRNGHPGFSGGYGCALGAVSYRVHGKQKRRTRLCLSATTPSSFRLISSSSSSSDRQAAAIGPASCTRQQLSQHHGSRKGGLHPCALRLLGATGPVLLHRAHGGAEAGVHVDSLRAIDFGADPTGARDSTAGMIQKNLEWGTGLAHVKEGWRKRVERSFLLLVDLSLARSPSCLSVCVGA